MLLVVDHTVVWGQVTLCFGTIVQQQVKWPPRITWKVVVILG